MRTFLEISRKNITLCHVNLESCALGSVFGNVRCLCTICVGHGYEICTFITRPLGYTIHITYRMPICWTKLRSKHAGSSESHGNSAGLAVKLIATYKTKLLVSRSVSFKSVRAYHDSSKTILDASQWSWYWFRTESRCDSIRVEPRTRFVWQKLLNSISPNMYK